MRDQGPELVSTKLQRIAKLARTHAGEPLTALAHHIDIDFLKEAFRRTRKDGAVGVDGQRASEYAMDLEANLQSLLERLRSGRYRAPPVRRVHIPKGDGTETRPIGIPTFEDKVLQRAVTMILDAVYEQDFRPCSFGFRPGRSVHDALDVLQKELMAIGGRWVLEVDIRKFYDTIDHGILRKILDQRVRDGVLRRVLNKWLKAGVLEGGELRHPELGTPQGGVVSPILANVYLHEAIDRWFERDVLPRLRGRASLVRFADDFVVVFERKDDASRVFEVLPKRLERFGLKLHPEKTRLIRFIRPPKESKVPEASRVGPGTFRFLGFTHFWERGRKGGWVVRRKTAPDRFTRALRKVSDWIRSHRHWRIAEQHTAINRKLAGHYGFYGITGNYGAVARFKDEVQRAWHKWLNRRSQKRTMAWERFNRVLTQYPLSKPRLMHSTSRRAANP